jgi:hypothetical protein
MNAEESKPLLENAYSPLEPGKPIRRWPRVRIAAGNHMAFHGLGHSFLCYLHDRIGLFGS